MRSTTGVLALVACSVVVIAGAALGSPAGTAFTYQGQLDKNNQPANTSCNFQFSLWDALSGGSQVATMPPVNGIQVTDGLFTTTLDFGSGAFTGQARWLQIALQCTGDGGFTTLLPRQPLTPAPYAVFALGGNTGLALPYSQGIASPNVNVFDITNTATSGSGDGISGKTMSNGTDAFGVVGEAGGTSGTTGGVLGRAVTSPIGTGVVGVGTANGAYFESSAPNSNSGYAGVVAYAASTDGVKGSGGLLNAGVRGDGGFAGVYGTCTGGDGVRGESPSGRGVTGGHTGSTGTYSGVYGFTSSTNPNSSGVEGTSDVGQGVLGRTLGGKGVYGVASSGRGVYGYSGTGDGVFGENSGAYTAGVAGVAHNVQGRGGYFVNDAPGGVALFADGKATVRILEILGGADLAEHFDVVDEAVEPGTVVVIDAAHPGKLKASVEPNDSKVVGVISGAGGIRAGMSLRQDGAPADGEHQVALTGRVYVKCDASYRPIEPGALLTTSPTPGHAMAVAEPAAAAGAILGKAMTALHEGKGLVLVFVSLQ